MGASSDLIVPKFIVRFGIEWFLGYTRWREVRLAVQSLWTGSCSILRNSWTSTRHTAFPPRSFGGGERRKLCYALADAKEWITRIRTGVLTWAYTELSTVG